MADKNIKDGYLDVEARTLDALDNKQTEEQDKNQDQADESNQQNQTTTSNNQDETTNNNLEDDPLDENIDRNQIIDSSDGVEPEMMDFLLTFNLEKKHRIAVFTGVTLENIRKGSARLESSAFPGQEGNCIIYGHRDSSFKPMKNLKIGDTIDLLTINGLTTYTVDEIYITTPEDSMINQDSNKKMLTLVTCYPFVLSGPANDRCVIVAYSNN